MNAQLSKAISDAMKLLRTQNVGGATAAIQRVLSGRTVQSPAASHDAISQGVQSRRNRHSLGAVLEALSANRKKFTPEEPPEIPDVTTRIEPDERFISRRYESSAGSLDYKLYVPHQHANREVSLVLMLHGCTQDPDDFARGTQMNRLADENGLIVAYPHQPRSRNAQGCWNWFDPRHQQRGFGEPALLAGLVQKLALEFGVSDRRIFAAGLSAGGAMADILAATYPELFDAVAIHSGLPIGAANDVISAFRAMKGHVEKTSVAHDRATSRKIIFHGGSDTTVHESNGERIFNQLVSETPGSVVLTTNTIVSGRRVTRIVLDDKEGRSIGEYWKMDAAGHAWFGGNSSGTFTDPNGPSASQEMLRFFFNP